MRRWPPLPAENVDYVGYLLRLCEREVIEREHRAAERRVKAARFPVIKTLDTFDFAAAPSINKALVRELLRCDYIERRENVLLVGNSGHGQDAPGRRWRSRRAAGASGCGSTG